MKTTPKPAQHPSFCRGCLADRLSRIGEKDGYALLRCAGCGGVVADPFPSEEELTAFYQSYKDTAGYAGKKPAKIRRALKRARRILARGAPGKRFLDIGCNVGYMTAAARETGFDAFGIDIDADAVAAAKKNFPEAKFEAVSIEDLAARGEKFDVVYTSEVVEHVRDPDSFIGAVSTVLAPGGLLYLTTPDGAHFGVPRDFTRWKVCCPPEHLSYFSRKGLAQLLARHGIKVEKFQLAFKPGIKVFARRA
jgi:2-polyprenyl-3-methyl-5-hydroxy-6-metoxy-1,4-benzoquinol methylase